MSSLHYLKDQDIIILLEEYVLKAYLQKKQKELLVEFKTTTHSNAIINTSLILYFSRKR